MRLKQALNQKELAFCTHYHSLQNPREAALAAGYPADRAARTGRALLARPEISAQLTALAREEEGRDLASQVRAGLHRLAFGSAADAAKLLFWEEDPGPQALEGLDLFQVAELRRGKNGVEVKFFDRIKALEALAALDRPETAAGTALPFYRALLGSVEQPAEDGGRDD